MREKKEQPTVSSTDLKRSKQKNYFVEKRLMKNMQIWGKKKRQMCRRNEKSHGKTSCPLDMQLINHHSFLQLQLSWEKRVNASVFHCGMNVSTSVCAADIHSVSTAERLWPYRAAAPQRTWRNVWNVHVRLCRIVLWHPSVPSEAVCSLSFVLHQSINLSSCYWTVLVSC